MLRKHVVESLEFVTSFEHFALARENHVELIGVGDLKRNTFLTKCLNFETPEEFQLWHQFQQVDANITDVLEKLELVSHELLALL